MICKGDNCIIKSYDNKESVVKVIKIDGNRAHVQYKNKEHGKCYLRHLIKKRMKSVNEHKDTVSSTKSTMVNTIKSSNFTKNKNSENKISEKPIRLCKLYHKIGKNIVSFGIYKNKKLTYKQLLNQYENYCRVIVRNNYNIPTDFKEYCCFELL